MALRFDSLKFALGGLVLSPLLAAGLAASPGLSALPLTGAAADPNRTRTAVLAGGCFWGMEAVFEHVKGVKDVVSGYSGGNSATANYMAVSSGLTGHAEAVKITYDPAKVSFEQLLAIFFTVAHNPTERNRQGPDVGSQYRSAIFFADAAQERDARATIARLNQGRRYPHPIVTQVVPLQRFTPAEAYHQNFVVNNPTYPYVVVHDLPKLAQLKLRFPGLMK
jgi:peptide-methionine (S)-S-oxide reductase